jgi:hypothetical protein
VTEGTAAGARIVSAVKEVLEAGHSAYAVSQLLDRMGVNGDYLVHEAKRSSSSGKSAASTGSSVSGGSGTAAPEPEGEEPKGKPANNKAQFSDNEKLNVHYENHGSEFGASSETEYENLARDFLTGPKKDNVLETIRSNGDILRYGPQSNTLGVMSKDGNIRTFYKPEPKSPLNPRGYGPQRYSSPQDYFNAQ